MSSKILPMVLFSILPHRTRACVRVSAWVCVCVFLSLSLLISFHSQACVVPSVVLSLTSVEPNDRRKNSECPLELVPESTGRRRLCVCECASGWGRGWTLSVTLEKFGGRSGKIWKGDRKWIDSNRLTWRLTCGGTCWGCRRGAPVFDDVSFVMKRCS